jgi:biotin carboxylase
MAKQKNQSDTAAVKSSTDTSTPESKIKLRGISEIRRFFADYPDPIYFISATNFNLLGADEWVRNFKYICYLDCFDGKHPNVFVPQEIPHAIFNSIEEINNYLLEHKEVADYLAGRGGKPKALFLMFDQTTEALLKELGVELWFPPADLRNHLDNKVTTTRVAEKAGVPSVPNVLAKVNSYADLTAFAPKLGTDLVIQTPFGDSGHTTFFIASEKDFETHAAEIIREKEVKIMRRIRCRQAAQEGCVTKLGAVVGPLMTELVGFPELTPYKGGWCGNEIFAGAFNKKIRDKARKHTEAFGNQLRAEGYTGYYELDYLFDLDTNELYLGELNPRITGASSMTNHALFAQADMPLFMFHLLEFAGVDYKFSIREINRRWANPASIDSWSQLIIKHISKEVDLLTHAPESGLYRMDAAGEVSFVRFETRRRAIESENDAFFMRIMKAGDYRYEGADLGILISRGRMMTDKFELNTRARQWINAIRSRFVGKPLAPAQAATITPEIGNFKLL